ncbi:hypothetical protein HDU82_007380 [Entophlyctis luteolus]|nr:hypothetical protein HDU82_007380 [Entophlyctis luteolus]
MNVGVPGSGMKFELQMNSMKNAVEPARKGPAVLPVVKAVRTVLVLVTVVSTTFRLGNAPPMLPTAAIAPPCGQSDPLAPERDPQLSDVFSRTFASANTSYAEAVASRLARLVQIPSQSFDFMKDIPIDNSDDSYRLGFVEMRNEIAALWPRIHGTLNLTAVNRYGLVWTWPGTDDTLKPVLLTAHIDTVPVNVDTLNKWTYPPFSGTIAAGHVWGRGASDCKAQITSILDALELLIENGFAPRRTLLVAFGFDEEISGRQGAGTIASYLHSIYGTHNIEFILDEGSSIETQYGATFVRLSTGEKGYMDVSFTVNTAGGHSSIPPRHTSIGYLAKVIDALEENPSQPKISDRNLDESPLFGELQCGAVHGPSMPQKLKTAIIEAAEAKSPSKRKKAQAKIVELLETDTNKRALMMTTQAIDLISGGVKVNALPESATAVGNYRIHPDESVRATEAWIGKTVKKIADKHHLGFSQTFSNGESVFVAHASGSSVGNVTVMSLADTLEPAPVTATTAKPFQLVSGTIRHSLVRKDEKLFVTPSMPTGNSDTRHFWSLSKNIFRFTPLRDHDSHNIHTVDEKCKIEDLVQSAGFFFELIRNADEAVF